MNTKPVTRGRKEKGQAILLVLVAMGLVLMGALGLAIDGAQLYAQHQMAQTAADAAAQAAIMSVFDGTNSTESPAYGTVGTTLTCPTTADTRSPCAYAQKNGFSLSAADVVTVAFSSCTVGTCPWISTSDPVNLVKANVTRTLNTGLMRFLGSATSTIKATATAAIVTVTAPVPILITHPTKSGALDLQGTGSGDKIKILGGPPRSIQVNSSSPTATTVSGNPIVNLSVAGPSGTGADFASWGGPGSPAFTLSLGTTGHYVQPASPIWDPLEGVTAPVSTGFPTGATTGLPVATPAQGCVVASPPKTCHLYSPGIYNSAINVTNEVAVFKPGIYYMNGVGFSTGANGTMVMATGFPPDSGAGTTGTNWTQNMLVYITGSGTPAATGAINIGANGVVNLIGSPNGPPYQGILFFVNRTAAAKTHTFDGGGGMTLIGTIYATNCRTATSSAGCSAATTMTSSLYQETHFQGNAGSSTNITGQIITSVLSLAGSPGIVMTLSSTPSYTVRQVALVN